MEKISIILKCEEEIKNVKSQLYFYLSREIDFLKMNVVDDKIIIKGCTFNTENVQHIIEKFNVEILEFSTSKEMPKGWLTFNDCIDSGKITIKFGCNIQVVWSNDWIDFFEPIKNKNMFDRVRIFSKNKKVVATKKYQTTNWLDVRDEILDIMEILDNEEELDLEYELDLDNGECKFENPNYEFWDSFNQY